MDQYKTCRLCQTKKSLDDFHNDAAQKSGKTARCKSCRNILENAYRIEKQTGTWQSKKKPKLSKAEIREKRNAHSRSLNHYLVFKNATNRAKSFGVTIGTFSKKEIKKLYGSPCFYCGSDYRMSIDHIVPLARGGTHTIGNVISCCSPCNSSKKNNLITEWKKVRGW